MTDSALKSKADLEIFYGNKVYTDLYSSVHGLILSVRATVVSKLKGIDDKLNNRYGRLGFTFIRQPEGSVVSVFPTGEVNELRLTYSVSYNRKYSKKTLSITQRGYQWL